MAHQGYITIAALGRVLAASVSAIPAMKATTYKVRIEYLIEARSRSQLRLAAHILAHGRTPLLAHVAKRHRRQGAWASLDDLVGAGKQGRRHAQSKRLSRLEINDQPNERRLLDG